MVSCNQTEGATGEAFDLRNSARHAMRVALRLSMEYGGLPAVRRGRCDQRFLMDGIRPRMLSPARRSCRSMFLLTCIRKSEREISRSPASFRNTSSSLGLRGGSQQRVDCSAVNTSDPPSESVHDHLHTFFAGYRPIAISVEAHVLTKVEQLLGLVAGAVISSSVKH